MIFSVNVINHTLPQVSVIVADSGVPAVTYNQIKYSLGNHIYNIEKLYLQSTLLEQLIGTIQYNRYEASGNQEFKNITTTVDPFQPAKAIYVELKDYADTPFFILNGNSNLQTTILPNAYIQLTLYCKRITNSFGMNLNSFKMMEELFGKPDFFKRYGDLNKIEETDKKIEKKASFTGYEIEDDSDSMPVIVLSIAAIYAGVWFLVKKNKE
jgi:hypothetical protein